MAKRTTAAKAAKKTKGRNRPKKADVEAFASGQFTALTRRVTSAISAAERAFKSRQKSDARFDAAIDKIEGKVAPDGNGTTVTHPSGKLRLRLTKNRQVSGNALAEEGARLVNEYAAELVTRAGTTNDERNFAGFLTGIIQRSKSQIRMNKNLTDFLKMKFEDPRLTEAQKLFAVGFDAKDSKRGAYLEVCDDEGNWSAAVWDEETGEWVAA